MAYSKNLVILISGDSRRLNKNKKTSSTSSSISSRYITNLLEEFKTKQNRKTTGKNYYNVWKNFNRFLIQLDYKPKTWEERAAWYGAYLVDKGVQSSTLRSYISGIKKTLVLDEYAWDDEKLKLSILVNVCKNENDERQTRLPIQNGLLELILFEIERYYEDKNQPYLEIMWRTLYSLAYYGLFRIGELATGTHPVKARDVHQARYKKKLLFLLRSSKTHGRESRPQEITIEGDANLDNKHKNYFCPYTITREYLNVRGDYSDDNDPLFIFRDGTPVSAAAARKFLKTLLKRLQLNPALYGTHSFRIGRATDLQKAGYSVDKIKQLGRWRSNAVYKYLK